MARHYLTAVGAELTSIYEIPAPAVDMVSNQTRFGTSGIYVSGGGYVRRSQFGAQTLSVSWNNLNSEDIAVLRNLNEGGIFVWDNPLARSNVVLPWLARHGDLGQGSSGMFGYSTQTYLLSRFPKITNPEFALLSGSYSGYPGLSYATKYTVNSGGISPRIGLFVLPEGYRVQAWAVGETTGLTRISITKYLGPVETAIVPFNMPTTDNTELPTDYSTLTNSGNGTALVQLTVGGEGELTLQSLQLRVEPIGSPEEPLTYSPGLGNSGMEFTEEGLSIVQHSAALDMQSATATWMETGWWK